MASPRFAEPSGDQRLLTIQIRTDHDLVLARQRARQIATWLGFELIDQVKISTAVSEVVRNALGYGGGGMVEFVFTPIPKATLVVTVTDSGPGIPHIDEILRGDYRSKTGMGKGILGTRRVMDRMDVANLPSGGTSVRMVKLIPARSAPITSDLIGAIVSAVSKGVVGHPLGEIQQQNQELLRVLGELQQRQLEAEESHRLQERHQADLIAVNRNLQHFACTASHDLQEPLRMVSSYLGLLKRRSSGKLDEKETEYLGHAVDGAERMSRMVRDLLQFASADSASVCKAVVESSAIVADALKNLKLKIADVNAVVTIAELPQIAGDRVLLAHVFQNLISNGIKFQSTRVPEIMISAALVDGDHHFTVRDNGIGIPPESVDQIFGLFQRLHGVDQYPGTGIGLSLCKRIVERHGGRIGVNSTLGVGSAFWFTLPAEAA